MKELSVEEKAQRYDEAKVRMKEFLKEWENCGAVGEALEKAQNVFPELRESDDEKILKELIEKVKETPACIGFNDKNATLAWLEKQGQKETAWNKEDEENMNNVLYILNQLKDTSSYKEDNIAKKTINWVKSLKYRLCSNNEYDKDMLGAIVYCIKNNRPLEKEHVAWLKKQGEPVEINPTEFDTRLQALIGKFDSLPKEELIGSLSFWMNVVQNNGTYIEEKTTDKIDTKVSKDPHRLFTKEQMKKIDSRIEKIYKEELSKFMNAISNAKDFPMTD